MKLDDANGIAEKSGVTALRAVIDTTPNALDPKFTHGPEVLSSAEFVRGFSPPDYLIEGILRRGSLYSNTAKTGDAKTAITLLLQMMIAAGKAIGTRDVAQGRCLMLVGENPDDVRARVIAQAEQMGLSVDEIGMHFIAGVFPIPALKPMLEAKSKELGGFALVVVDTGAAYFNGNEENSNTELGDYARVLRTLTKVHGEPCVIVNCHPVKNATADNLIPRGGGAFLAEVDGNLCCRRTESTVEMHWQGKFRGPEFAPIAFELQTVTSNRLRDSKGKLMPTVIARSLTELEHASHESTTSRDLERLLIAMAANRGASTAMLAENLDWFGKSGDPLKTKVSRLQEMLRSQRLVAKELNRSVLTAVGETTAKRLAS